MLIVLGVIVIILLAALPSGGDKLDRAKIIETINLVKMYQPQIEQYYMVNEEFPANNDEAGMPDPESILGNYLEAVYLVDGAIHLQLGNKLRPELKGKFISLRPIFVPGEENAPISWICGQDIVPPGMVAAGENRTDLESYRLPTSCR